jgi:hypothetical protein
MILREDGVAVLDVRGTIESHDGALIYMTYNGVADLGADGYQRFVDGDPNTHFTIHTAPRCVTAHPDYQWLNRLQCIGVGEGNLVESFAAYDIYALK